MHQHSLNGGAWTVYAVGDLSNVPTDLRSALTAGVPATVPGCVHTDLLAARLIPDPYLADNEHKLLWIGRTDWKYTCRFSLDADALSHDRLELVCAGLDTIARIELNGAFLATTANMHQAQRINLRPAAIAGENHLAITFSAPMTYAESQEAIYPDLPRVGGASGVCHPHNLMRKMSCNMGWDWGPEVTTAGIWRPIGVEAWSTARIAYVRPLVTEATPKRAVVTVHIDIDRAAAASTSCTLQLFTPESQPVAEIKTSANSATLEVPNPQLWWPIGHGSQPRYRLQVLLHDANQKLLDSREHLIGLRTTALSILPDPAPVDAPVPHAQGESMTLLVNNKPVYCKGANWIPDDCFPHRVTPHRYRERIVQARDANMNMLRIWGGGTYESDAFYDICDELGIMVWQDFLFACACYREEEPYRSLVEAEVRDNVARLAPHPSLVIWNGCNENVMGTFDWGPNWRAIREQGQRTWGLGYYLHLLPEILGELDPSRPYWPASPYSGSMDRLPNANEYGNVHIWDVWHGSGQYRNYLAYYPRMATEFGYHGPACYATVANAIDPAEMWWNSRQMQLHNKNGRPGQEQTNTRMADDFVPPTDNFDDWHYLAQVMQARALSMGIEWFRALYPWNAGALYWQFNDCWPVSSWSAVDGAGRAKPLLHASRRFFAPRLTTIKPSRVTPASERIGPLHVYLHNDTDEAWQTSCVLRQMSLAGRILSDHTERLTIAARSLARFPVPDEMRADPAAFLVAETNAGRGFWWFSPDKRLSYPNPRFEAELSREGDTHRLTIHAQTLLRDLCLFPDRLNPDATVDDACITLLPNDRFTFTIRSTRNLSLASLTAPPILNCVNRFGA